MQTNINSIVKIRQNMGVNKMLVQIKEQDKQIGWAEFMLTDYKTSFNGVNFEERVTAITLERGENLCPVLMAAIMEKPDFNWDHLLIAHNAILN